MVHSLGEVEESCFAALKLELCFYSNSFL